MDPEAQIQEAYTGDTTTSSEFPEAKAVMVPAAKQSQAKEKPRSCLHQRRLLIGIVAAAIGLITIIAVSTGGSRTSATLANDVECSEDYLGDQNVRRLQTEKGFEWVGCFQRERSVDTIRLDGTSNLRQQAEACSEHCFTRHFGVVESKCSCFVESPAERLSIGSCESVCSVPVNERMNTYFKMTTNDKCNQETTSAVRNFLVEEDDTPFGFDILTNEFRSSPFELYNDECGTNIYEVQTEISEGSNELSTSSQLVSEFALERRSSLSSSISTSVEGGRKGLFVKASFKASASLDQEQKNMFKSSGAQSSGSKVFTSLGVKRLAEVKITDFVNKKYFVTFSPQFGAAIRRYKSSDFSKSIAREIFKEYGMFVMERGIFGGFMQLRTTAQEDDLKKLFASEEESRRCFEAAVSGKASAFGFHGSFSVEGGACSQAAASAMQNLQSKFAEEASEQTVTGGKIQEGELVVTPEFSTLLTSKDKYPAGDDGIQLRLLTDFLHPEKISPLEVKRLLLAESDFLEIKEHLEQHILEELVAIDDSLSQCIDCMLPYLEVVEGNLQCVCYDKFSEPTKAGNFLVNGSFESNGVAGNTYKQIPMRDVVGWKPVDKTSKLEVWGKGFLGVQPTDGNSFVELDGDAGINEGYYQDIPTIADQRYLLEFDMRARTQDQSNTDGESVVIEWCGEKTDSHGYRAQDWETKRVIVKGTGETCRLVLRESRADSSDGHGALVDNVRLTFL